MRSGSHLASADDYVQRFGLNTSQDDDMSEIIDSFLNILAMHDLDFHSSFRTLSSFRPSIMEDSATLDAFLARLADNIPKNPTDNKRSEVRDSFKPWLKTYAARVKSEQESWAASGEDWEEYRCAEMRKVNPRFVLRQWVLEETIKKLEEGEGLERRRVLAHILKVRSNTSTLTERRLISFDRWQPTRSSRMAGNCLAAMSS